MADKPAVDITDGNVLKNVLYMGIPSMIGFGAMTIYALTDIYWVGRLGTAHVAALTMFGAIAWILGSTNQIVGTGSVALISRRYGEREYEATRDVIRQTLLLKFSLAVIMAVIGLLAVPFIIRFMSDDPEVHRQFYEGLRPGARIPWRPWVVPLAAWSIMIAAFYAATMGMMLLLRRPWVDQERRPLGALAVLPHLWAVA